MVRFHKGLDDLVDILHLSYTVFPRFDALHVLDASDHFDAGGSGHNTF